MIILLITILIFCIGVGCLIKHHFSNNIFDYYEMYGGCIITFALIILAIEIILLIIKPIDYANFKIEYDVIKDTITSSEDIRDTNYTQKLIEINTEIQKNREWKDNIIIGLFYNEKIAELELLVKE